MIIKSGCKSNIRRIYKHKPMLNFKVLRYTFTKTPMGF